MASSSTSFASNFRKIAVFNSFAEVDKFVFSRQVNRSSPRNAICKVLFKCMVNGCSYNIQVNRQNDHRFAVMASNEHNHALSQNWTPITDSGITSRKNQTKMLENEQFLKLVIDQEALFLFAGKEGLKQASHKNAFRNIIFKCSSISCDFAMRGEMQNNGQYKIFVSKNFTSHNHDPASNIMGNLGLPLPRSSRRRSRRAINAINTQEQIPESQLTNDTNNSDVGATLSRRMSEQLSAMDEEVLTGTYSTNELLQDSNPMTTSNSDSGWNSIKIDLSALEVKKYAELYKMTLKSSLDSKNLLFDCKATACPYKLKAVGDDNDKYMLLQTDIGHNHLPFQLNEQAGISDNALNNEAKWQPLTKVVDFRSLLATSTEFKGVFDRAEDDFALVYFKCESVKLGCEYALRGIKLPNNFYAIDKRGDHDIYCKHHPDNPQQTLIRSRIPAAYSSAPSSSSHPDFALNSSLANEFDTYTIRRKRRVFKKEPADIITIDDDDVPEIKNVNKIPPTPPVSTPIPLAQNGINGTLIYLNGTTHFIPLNATSHFFPTEAVSNVGQPNSNDCYEETANYEGGDMDFINEEIVSTQDPTTSNIETGNLNYSWNNIKNMSNTMKRN